MWVYPRYNHDPSLPALQAAAMVKHSGLWFEPNLVWRIAVNNLFSIMKLNQDLPNNGSYWLCFETMQAVYVAERTDNDWFRNVVSDTIFFAFCDAHFGCRLTICKDDPSDVFPYTIWTYENSQRQFEKVAGHRMRSMIPFVFEAALNESKCIVRQVFLLSWKRHSRWIKLKFGLRRNRG